MKPEIWGRYCWNFIHIMTLGYPMKPTENEKTHYRKFFNNLIHVLPCEKCRHNMSSHLKKIPLTNDVLNGRNNLVKWGIDFHNIVNYYTGKEMLTYTESLNEINKLLKPQSFISNKLIISIVIGLLLGLLCILYYNKKLKY